MGRNKAPFPSIVHMKLLMELYRELHSIPYKAEDITDTDITIELMKCLRKDQVISGDSKNLVEKLRGNPFIREVEKCNEGIEVSILNNIAKIILSSPKIKIIGNEDTEAPNHTHYWSVFKDKISLPGYFDDLYSKIDIIKYYKYIQSKEQREQIDNFVKRKVGEFYETKEYHNYCVYFYDENQKQVETGILTIDNKNKIATLKYFSGSENNLRTSSVQRTDMIGGFFQLHNSVLYLNLSEEDESKRHLRTNICLSAPSTNFLYLSFLKGSYSTTINHGEVPTAGVIMLERKDNFSEALKQAKSVSTIDPRIFFELIGQRLEVVAGKKLKSTEDFYTKRTFDLVRMIKGAYIIGFIKTPDNEFKDSLYITKGICYIYENGLFNMQVANIETLIQGYIHNKIYFNDKVVKMTNFYEDALDGFKNDYSLVIHASKQTGKVEKLVGVYSSISKGLPRVGEIIFLKKDGYNSFEELKSTYSDELSTRSRFAKDDIISDDERQIVEYVFREIGRNETHYMLHPKITF